MNKISEDLKPLYVTTALPYANNNLHLGHIMEQVQADIWVRYWRLKGRKVYFISASDCHGTPIFIQSETQKITPEELINHYYISQKNESEAFFISFDNYSYTHTKSCKDEVYKIYYSLLKTKSIKKKEIKQWFDEDKKMFLSDRMVRGICPKCRAGDQYGDNCEICGSTYDSTELLEPYSIISLSKPILKNSIHYFFDLKSYKDFLVDFINNKLHCHQSVKSKLFEWLNDGLKDWDISRDSPYFGFLIPEETDKYFYVWLDAPVGYIDGIKIFLNSLNEDVILPWNINSNFEIAHFIGKDIIYFHGLFWPSLLKAANLRLPDYIFVHGHVTFNGSKMSKSRGNFMFAKDFRAKLPVYSFRYYIASRSNSGIDDIDFKLEDVVIKCNNDLINKWLNLASRSSKILELHFGSLLSNSLDSDALYFTLDKVSKLLDKLYIDREYTKVINTIMEIIDNANRVFNDCKPWIINDQKRDKVQKVCTDSINVFLWCALFLKPIIPDIVGNVEKWINNNLEINNYILPIFSKKLEKYKQLAKRLYI